MKRSGQVRNLEIGGYIRNRCDSLHPDFHGNGDLTSGDLVSVVVVHDGAEEIRVIRALIR